MQNILKTKQFSTKTIVIEAIIPHTVEDYTYLSFLSRLLGLSTKKYPSTQDFLKATENLYNAYFMVDFSLRGQEIILKIKVTYINLLNQHEESLILDLLKDILYQPNIHGNKWNKTDFKEVFDIVQHRIKTYHDNPSRYAKLEGLKLLAPETSLGGFPDGDIDIINKITDQNITAYYYDFLKRANFQIFAMGDYEKDFKLLLDNTFSFQTKPYAATKINIKKVDKPRVKTEQLANQQAVIFLGFVVEKLTDFETKYVFTMLNDLFGGQIGIAKLFRKIREERGLAYSIFSSRINFSNLMTVQAGVKTEKIDETFDLTLESLNEIKEGNFDHKLIANLIDVYEQNLKAVFDHKSDALNQFIKEYNGDVDSIENKIKNYRKVTPEDVIKLANKCHLAAIYKLEGGK